VKIDIKQLRELLAIVSANDISELTVEVGEEKVTVKKHFGAAAPAHHESASEAFEVQAAKPAQRELSFDPKPDASPSKAEDEAPSEAGLVPVTSPMVGTFYRAASPTAAPYVDIGDRITVGQTVCIIEAMKLMNDMPAEVAGRIVKVCVDNGSTVEYGQPLFLVDPKG
jgi:acetyl-CoA carboxylase biotin carboxyl carrier protein